MQFSQQANDAAAKTSRHAAAVTRRNEEARRLRGAEFYVVEKAGNRICGNQSLPYGAAQDALQRQDACGLRGSHEIRPANQAAADFLAWQAAQ